MNMPNINWERLSRKEIFKSPFLQVLEDSVRLPNGNTIDDYTLIKKPDIVIVVATTPDNKIITFREYKYAADRMLNTLPAGHVEEGEDPLKAAKRELLEETGYVSHELMLCGTLCEYPTKDMHNVYVVSAKNAQRTGVQSLEDTEGIEDLREVSMQELQQEIAEGKWSITAVLAAFAVAGVLR